MAATTASTRSQHAGRASGRSRTRASRCRRRTRTTPNEKGFTGPEEACANVALLTAILEAAGKDLNYATFRQAGESLGEVDIPGDPSPRTYGPPPATDGSPKAYLSTFDVVDERLRPRGFVTDFGEPYVDVDEWRDAPVRHRYVHGGFAGTETRFSIYLPPAGAVRGPVLPAHHPGPRQRAPRPGGDGRARTRSGSRSPAAPTSSRRTAAGPRARPGSSVDPTIAAYRANAAAAQHSRVIAAEMYGEHRPYGYAVRRQRRRLPHDRRRREHHRRVGRLRPVRDRLADGDPEHVHGPHARAAGPAATASTRSSTPSSRGAPATCTRASTTRSAARSPR